MRSGARGFGAGVAATLAMSAVMFAGRRTGRLGRMPPERITARALRRLGIPHGRAQQDVAAGALHLAFGGAAGALFEPLRRGLGLRLSPALQGAAFGTAVWAVSYLGWVPALGVMPPPSRDRPRRPEVMLAAHWVYGGVLGWLCAAAAPPRPGRARRPAPRTAPA